MSIRRMLTLPIDDGIKQELPAPAIRYSLSALGQAQRTGTEHPAKPRENGEF